MLQPGGKTEAMGAGGAAAFQEEEVHFLPFIYSFIHSLNRLLMRVFLGFLEDNAYFFCSFLLLKHRAALVLALEFRPVARTTQNQIRETAFLVQFFEVKEWFLGFN